ncbi:hypothetical protein INT45_008527 [Circinella minor]|uniref:Arrestin-like N-terminal domain-containing protein n=1 Tax=Circinella minor TaxID=1195481 RepID=A0A8H7SF33_9FUNG|nr:hypothetical protein INT45_008527 [Circinella minor]
MSTLSTLQFKIQLENRSIILGGTPEQSNDRLLQGHVLLYLRAPIRIKSIKLRLFGQMKLQWHETTKKRTVIDHEWILLELSKGSDTIESGIHSYPFQLQLPGNLPETIEDSSYGHIIYKLKAVAVRSGLASNLVAREVVKVYRQPLHSSLQMGGFVHDDGDSISSNSDTRSIRMSGNHENIVTYELECRKKIYKRGDQISVKVHLWPHDNNNEEEGGGGEWSVRHISSVFKEITTFDNIMTSNLNRDDKIDETRILRFTREEDFPSLMDHYHHRCSKTIRIPVPRYAKCDTVNSLLNIVHKLQFTIVFVNTKNGRLSEFRTVLPVIVIQDELAEALRLAEGDLLPSYEDARRSAPYVPGMITAQVDLSSAASTPINTPTDELDDWLCMPYNTTMMNDASPSDLCNPSVIPPPLYDISLPSYETIISSTHHRDIPFIR